MDPRMQDKLIDKDLDRYLDDVDRVEAGGALQEKPSPYFYTCVLIASIGAFGFGCALGFTSPTMAANKMGKSSQCPTIECSDSTEGHCGNRGKMNCELQFDENFQSLFGSIINFGCLAGALAGGAFVDRFGKKVGILSSLLIYIIGWAMVFFVPSPSTSTWDAVSSEASNMSTIEAVLITARLVIGFGVGIICCSVSNYQTEICTLDLRGAVGTVFQSFIVLGLFAVYLVGSIVSWRLLALLNLIVAAVGFLLTFLIIESPVWLVTKGREDEARAALIRMRDPSVGSHEEQWQDLLPDKLGPGDAEPEGGISALLKDKTSRKALSIGVGLMFVQQLSGINAIMFYAGEIFSAVPGTTDATANGYSTGMQAMQVVVTFSSALFMDKFGRQKILLFAGTGQFVTCSCLAMYYLFASCIKDDQGNVVSASLGLFPVFVLYGYTFFFSSGMGAIPWFIMGEIFKPNVKGIASSIATAVNWLLSFVITFTVASLTKGFDSMLHSALPHAIDAGMGGLFVAYGSVCFAGIFFVAFFVPETKGLTLKEVQTKLGEEKHSYSFAGSFHASFGSATGSDDFHV